MPQIAASDVTYAAVEGSAQACPSDPRMERVFTITFGDGSLTYTDGGIPLTKGKLGCPTHISSLHMMDAAHASGLVPKWNQTANTIRLYQDARTTAATAAALVEVLTSAAVAAMTLRVYVKGY